MMSNAEHTVSSGPYGIKQMLRFIYETNIVDRARHIRDRHRIGVAVDLSKIF